MAGIPIEDAITSRFENSTREELLQYCEDLGITDVRANADMQLLKQRIFSTLGIADRVIVSGGTAAKIYKSKILPTVNLTPSGRWGGRRRRIKVPRPSNATKSEAAMPIGWNGKATYWLPFDEPIDVPYPIFNILRQTRLPRVVQRETEGPGKTTEITTGWEFSDLPFSDYGDTPGTTELPCSLTEWFQEKGPKFYRDLSGRDLQMVADRCDVNTIGVDKKKMSPQEIADAVLVFLFGVAADDMHEDGSSVGAFDDTNGGFGGGGDFNPETASIT